VWEALECGAIPILDAGSPKRSNDEQFWKMALGNHPLPMVNDWAELPGMLPGLLENYDAWNHSVADWWQAYKQSYWERLGVDIAALKEKTS
jgi:hypothetical protein